ncbi:MAG: exodeoxyribonuclease VII large subunit [Spirochaetaceae bacterium]|nr:exodeoxyribonuclease VII large subunit [Spirochaetaceae bacterium]
MKKPHVDAIVIAMGFPAKEKAAADSSPLLTVSELTSLIKGNLEASFPDVTVEGEISNAKLASSGHFYFSLKDENSIIQAVMFKSKLAALGFAPSDGLRVRAHGAISVYAQRGQYQLIVQSLRKAGTGDILAMLEERKRLLASQGYFDAERKKALPRFPGRVAIVTSPTGAAIHDILNVLGRRNSAIDIVILPAPVQGAEAAPAIAKRIEQANRLDIADVIVVCRGGGSLEDLLPFSETVVVKAIAASRIPVISAVGHEIDWALSDFAADLRAPTPSAAAELVAESREVLLRELDQFQAVLESTMRSKLDALGASLEVFSPELVKARFEILSLPIVNRLDDAHEALVNSIKGLLADLDHWIALACSIIETASPQAVLKRGFSIVRRVGKTQAVSASAGQAAASRGGNEIVRSSTGLEPGEHLHISFAEGSALADVREVNE